MEEAKFNNLCVHYKDTFDIHLVSIKQRDTIFYGLLIILSVFTLQLSSTEIVAGMVNDYVSNTVGVKLGKSTDFISTLLWLLLFGFTTRYFEIVLEIERQYDYLHNLEEKLNSFYPDLKVFTREGEFYRNNFTLFSKWVWFLYTIFFPVLIIFCLFMKISREIEKMESIGVANQIIDFTCFIIILVGTLLYLYLQHGQKPSPNNSASLKVSGS